MRDDNRKQKRMMTILIAIIVVLVLILAYFFLVRPGINNWAYNKQVEGINYAYGTVVTQVQQQGYFALPLGKNEAGEDQTLVLVPYVPPQDQTPSQ